MISSSSQTVAWTGVLALFGVIWIGVNPVSAQVSNAADVTVVEITDNVLVEDTSRFGINLGGDTYYSGAALTKNRATENFEGTSYRQCHFGPGADERGMATWFSIPDGWKEMLVADGRYTILSGTSKGTTGRIASISTKQFLHQKSMKDFTYVEFDKKMAVPPTGSGFLLEALRLGDGQFRRLDGYWTSKGNAVEIGDTAPGSFGRAALNLNGGEGPAHVRFGTHYQRFGETNGRWRVRFLARAKSGTPILTVRADRKYGESKEFQPTATWAKHEAVLTVDKVPEPVDAKQNPHLTFLIEARGGAALIDDVEIWMEGDENPTAFRDDAVATLKLFNPGVVRNLQMGGSTLDNTLAPGLRSHSFASQRSAKITPYAKHSRHPYSLHEMYDLCKHLGSDPWYSLPGTFSQEEMGRFMEYLGASGDVGYGAKRAEMGQAAPWTEVFGTIHVEFGNEAWNNAGPYQCGGFNGPDYWRDLIDTAKRSPHYRPNVIFHTAGQAANSWLNRGLMPRTPNADRFGLAPYLIQRINRSDMELLDTNEKFFRWAFGWSHRLSTDPDGAMSQNGELSREHGIELSVYEVNHHTTGGDAPLAPRNALTTSLGGGLNVVNHMLTMLERHGVRTQCLFSLIQHSYNAQGIGAVRLWGSALCMRKGHERYRPTFLACATANRVIGGDLLEVKRSGADPTFDATGVFGKSGPPETIRGIPAIRTYAFADGKRRGLILINLDVTDAHSVAVKFSGRAANSTARSWLLSADSITANNEFENASAEVAIAQETIEAFADGAIVTLPPHSLRAIGWEVE